MKRIIVVISILLAFMTVTCAAAEKMRAVWVSTVYCLDYPSSASSSESELYADAEKIIKKVEKLGMNTVFLQVRSSADAIYPSKYFPRTKHIENKTCDILKIFCELGKAHKIGIFAWINPYRVTAESYKSKQEALKSLMPESPAVLHPESAILAKSGQLYFDPALSFVRELIENGVSEIIENYGISGIIFDDYFYPSRDFDGKSPEEKRENVNALIRETSEICRKNGVLFGVSPFGIWGNSSSIEGGSNTIGSQSYFDNGADSRLWVKNEWVDFIAPQLYWAIGNREGEFSELLRWWSEQIGGTNVKLIPCLGAYRIAEGKWQPQEIKDQLEMLKMLGKTSGEAYFRIGLINGELEKIIAENNVKPDMPRSSLAYSAELTVLSPESGGRFTENQRVCVKCTAPKGSKIVAFSGKKGVKFARNDGVLSAELPANKVISVISSRFGCVSLRAISTEIIESEPQTVITSIYDGKDGEYSTITFDTDRPCAANLTVSDYLYLDISPCRTGFLFETDLLEKMTVFTENGTCRYTFKPKSPIREAFLMQSDKKIILYLR